MYLGVCLLVYSGIYVVMLRICNKRNSYSLNEDRLKNINEGDNDALHKCVACFQKRRKGKQRKKEKEKEKNNKGSSERTVRMDHVRLTMGN